MKDELKKLFDSTKISMEDQIKRRCERYETCQNMVRVLCLFSEHDDWTVKKMRESGLNLSRYGVEKIMKGMIDLGVLTFEEKMGILHFYAVKENGKFILKKYEKFITDTWKNHLKNTGKSI
jgi:acetyl-CoA acetyltransferase